MERSNYFVERSDLEQSDHGTKLTYTVPEILKTSEDNLDIFSRIGFIVSITHKRLFLGLLDQISHALRLAK